MLNGFQYYHYPTLPLPEIFIQLEWSRDPNRLAPLPFAASPLLRRGFLLPPGSCWEGWGWGTILSPARSPFCNFCHDIFGIPGGALANRQSMRTSCSIITKSALICRCFLTLSKVMIIWLTYIPAISGELGPMLMSWLPYLEKKVTLGKGSWTMRRTTLKLDSKASCFHFDRVPYYSI